MNVFTAMGMTPEQEVSCCLRLHRHALEQSRHARSVTAPAFSRRLARGRAAYHLDEEARDARVRLSIALRLSRRGGAA